MAAGDLTTLDAVKAYLGIDPAETQRDVALQAAIAKQSAWFKAQTQNDVLTATYSETWDGNDGVSFLSAAYPVTSITSLTVDGVSIPASVSGSNGYVIVRGTVRLIGYVFTAGVGNCSITYAAGQAITPADVAGAVAELVALDIRQRERIGIMSQSVGGETVSFQTLTVPVSVQRVIDAYARPVIA